MRLTNEAFFWLIVAPLVVPVICSVITWLMIAGLAKGLEQIDQRNAEQDKKLEELQHRTRHLG